MSDKQSQPDIEISRRDQMLDNQAQMIKRMEGKIAALKSRVEELTKVTEAMVDRALAVRVDQIQGFLYASRELPHVIRDFRHGGVDIWAGSSHDTMVKMLDQLKMAAQISAALSLEDSRGGK